MKCKFARTAQLDAMLPSVSRRSFLRGSAAATAAVTGVGIGFAPLAQAAAPTKTLVYVFLRGGNDGLSLVVPTGGVDRGFYMDARDQTRLTPDASNVDQRTLPLDAGGLWGLHPWATGLKQLWDMNRLAIVHAAGHLAPDTHTRSHFDAQEQIELGTPGVQASQNGWLTRHLMSIPAVSGAVFTANDHRNPAEPAARNARLPFARAGLVYRLAAAVHRHGHRHVLHHELVDRFHAQVGKATTLPAIALDTR
jgi:uncharacterized protein (DUF1501 family)